MKALTLAATASATLEDTIYQFVKQQKLRAAWKITKASLENTENRKLALIARKMNPTLAKYTIAYGAIVEKGPIATTAMNRCGLDRETPTTSAGVEIESIVEFRNAYIDLAEAQYDLVQLE